MREADRSCRPAGAGATRGPGLFHIRLVDGQITLLHASPPLRLPRRRSHQVLALTPVALAPKNAGVATLADKYVSKVPRFADLVVQIV